MFTLNPLREVIVLCFLFHALQIGGARLYSTVAQANDPQGQDFIPGPAKQILTHLKSNYIEEITFGQGSTSWDQAYFAAHQTTPRGPGDKYYGLHATMDVYGHNLKPGQWSSTTFWFSHEGDGNTSSYNAFQVGWHICPDRYADSHPHFYVGWTRDGYNSTGCYNMDCPGFVREDRAAIAPGDAIRSVVPDGPIQNITLKVNKDQKTGDWWVYYGFNNIPTGVGYFPKSLFSYLAENATRVGFGAFVRSKNALPTPPMGSGALPNGGMGRAASFTDLRLIDEEGNSSPIMADLPTRVTNNKCHYITPIDHAVCYYGGPGGCIR